MAQWVRLCEVGEAPASGRIGEYQVHGVDVCLANHEGELAAVDNWCPHRRGPLSEGWLEDGKIICPWHAWGFDLRTGDCPEEHSRVPVFPLKREQGEILINIG